VESDLLESGCPEKVTWTKNGSSNEASSSTSDKDMVQAKTKTQTVKCRQTQSGPLTPVAVLSHSVSERGRISEGFVMIFEFISISQIICFVFLYLLYDFCHWDVFLVVLICGSWLVNY
jgi:hypothetical protein